MENFTEKIIRGRGGADDDEIRDEIASYVVEQRDIENDCDAIRKKVDSRVLSQDAAVLSQISRSNEPIFRLSQIGENRWIIKPTSLGQKVLIRWKADTTLVDREYSLYLPSPKLRMINKFRKLAPPMFVRDDTFSGPADLMAKKLARIDRLTDRIRRILRSKRMREAEKRFRRGAEENHKNFIRGLNWRAQTHDEVVIVRWDVHVEATPARELINKICDPSKFNPAQLWHVALLRNKYLEKVRSQLRAYWMGCSCVIEHGPDRGYHLHLFVMLKKTWTEDPVLTVERLGQMWIALTDGRGGFYNANAAKKGTYRYSFLGRVRLSDPGVQIGLQCYASYVTLAGLFIKFKIDPKFKSFTLSAFPKNAPKKKIGRPSNPPGQTSLLITVADALATRARFI